MKISENETKNIKEGKDRAEKKKIM
jgi:hypothetical protein